MVASTKFFDRVFNNEKGATSGWLFRATTNATASGMAIVKVSGHKCVVRITLLFIHACAATHGVLHVVIVCTVLLDFY